MKYEHKCPFHCFYDDTGLLMTAKWEAEIKHFAKRVAGQGRFYVSEGGVFWARQNRLRYSGPNGHGTVREPILDELLAANGTSAQCTEHDLVRSLLERRGVGV